MSFVSELHAVSGGSASGTKAKPPRKAPIAQRAFTLIELLVVISIISLLSSIVLASLNSARARARDAQRMSTIKELQNALALYDENNNSYPPASWANDCAGTNTSWQSALAPLIADKDISQIVDDPNYPNTAWPQCYYYMPNVNCNTGDAVHPYVLIFHLESGPGNFPSWNNEPNRYCVYP